MSCVITVNLVTALRGQEEFRTAEHLACIQEGRTAVQKWRVLLAEEALAETIAGYPVQGARQLRWLNNTGEWMMVKPLTVNGTELGAQEW